MLSGAVGFVGRMRFYLGEMFPLPRRAITAALLAFSVATCFGRAHATAVDLLSSHSVVACWSVFGLMLMLRLMDELKDTETDRRLFPWRPLPSGRVRASDIDLALALVVALYVPPHAGTGLGYWTAVAVLAYALVMFRWFFLPGLLRPRLLLTLATHAPIVPLMLLHLMVIFAAAAGLPWGSLDQSASACLVLLFWSPVFVWEIARKIRAPEEEDAYVTYSQLLGPSGAVALAVAAQTLGLVAGVDLWWRSGFSDGFLVCLAVGYLACLWAHLRFLDRPSAQTSRLAPFAEANLVSVIAGGLLA